jgi:hypothetical protein
MLPVYGLKYHSQRINPLDSKILSMYMVNSQEHSKSWLDDVAPPNGTNLFAHWRQRRDIVATKALANQPEDYYEESK